MSITTNKWAARTVVNGKVKICGKWYAPGVKDGSIEYDGRLDGMRLMFGRYVEYYCPEGKVVFSPFVCLWGTERDWKMHNSEEWIDYPGPNVIENKINWMWWYEI